MLPTLYAARHNSLICLTETHGPFTHVTFVGNPGGTFSTKTLIAVLKSMCRQMLKLSNYPAKRKQRRANIKYFV